MVNRSFVKRAPFGKSNSVCESRSVSPHNGPVVRSPLGEIVLPSSAELLPPDLTATAAKSSAPNSKSKSLHRSISSYALKLSRERSPKRVPTLFLGRSDTLPDSQTVIDHLSKMSSLGGVKEEDENGEAKPLWEQDDGKSMCMVFNLGQMLQNQVDEKTSTVAAKEKNEVPPIVPAQSRSDKTGPSGKGSHRAKPPLKRSQSEFSMRVSSAEFCGKNSMEAFRNRFLLNRESDRGSDVDPRSSSQNAIREAKKLELLRQKKYFSKSMDEASNAPDCGYDYSSSETMGSEGDRRVPFLRRRRRNPSDCLDFSDDQSEESMPCNFRPRRHSRQKNKIRPCLEDVVERSLNQCMPNLQNLISSEVNKQLSQLKNTIEDTFPKVPTDDIFQSVYGEIVSRIQESFDINSYSPIVENSSGLGSSMDNLAERETTPRSQHSVSCLDLSRHEDLDSDLKAKRKLMPSLSFAELGLSDDFHSFSSPSSKRPRKKPSRAKSLELLDSSDVEVEGDLSHLPIEHHVPLKTALVPLCRQMSESIQSLTCEGSDEFKAAKPKSLLLKLRVDLEKLEGKGESDTSMMEWDYYDHANDKP